MGCGPTEEYTPLIHVTPGAAARIDLLHHGAQDKPAAPSPARVHPMKSGEELGGANATGRAGDLVIENDEVVFVVAMGNLVDAADAHARTDELGGIKPAFGAAYTSRSSGVLADGTALVEARGYAHDTPGLVLATRFTLHPNDRAVVVETTLTNTTPAAVTLDLGDAVDWGSAEVRTSGTQGPFVGAVGKAASYALTTGEGVIESETAGKQTTTFAKRQAVIAPGKSASYARIVLVGPRADLSGLVAELTKMSGGEVGVVRVKLSAPVTNANVEVDDPGGKPLMDIQGDAQGIASELPPGKYALRYSKGTPAAVEVVAGHETEVTLPVP